MQVSTLWEQMSHFPNVDLIKVNISIWERNELVCALASVRVKGRGLASPFFPLSSYSLSVHRWIKRTHALLISLFIYPMRSPQKPKSLSHTHPPSQNVLTQISVCSHNPKQQMSNHFSCWRTVCVPGHNKHAYAFANTVAWAGVLCNLPEGWVMTHVQPVFQAPPWETGNQHGAMGQLE